MISLIGLIFLLIQLPRWMYTCLIGVFAFFTTRLLGLRSKVIMTNLAICFPGLTLKARQQLKNAFIKSTIHTLFDTVYCYCHLFSHKMPVTVEGLETMKSILQQHRPVILLTAHFNTTFIAGKFIHDNLQQKIANVFREQSHPLINYLYERKQRQYFLSIRKNNIRKMIQALQEHYPVIYLFDLNDSQGKTFIPFFNTPAATKTSLCKIAKITDAVVVPYVCLKKSDGHYHLQFMKPLENFPSDNATADLTRVSLLFEDIIKQYPEQYLWTHRRFKTRPEGEGKIY